MKSKNLNQSVQKTFTSPQIAREIKRQFADNIGSISINMRYKRQIGRFIRKIERAHKKAAKSDLMF